MTTEAEKQAEWLKNIAFKLKQAQQIASSPEHSAKAQILDRVLITHLDIIELEKILNLSINRHFKDIDGEELLFLKFEVYGVPFECITTRGEKEWDHYTS